MCTILFQENLTSKGRGPKGDRGTWDSSQTKNRFSPSLPSSFLPSCLPPSFLFPSLSSFSSLTFLLSFSYFLLSPLLASFFSNNNSFSMLILIMRRKLNENKNFMTQQRKVYLTKSLKLLSEQSTHSEENWIKSTDWDSLGKIR